jgi:hypothetical protein
VRHWKTETLVRGIVMLMMHRPKRRVLLATYNKEMADYWANMILDLAVVAGIHFGAKVTPGEWFTREGGYVRVTSVKGGVTGRGFTDIFVDDPIKSRAEAESWAIQEGTWLWFRDTLLSRRDPDANVFVSMARWHVNDLLARIIKELGWKYLCVSALAEVDDPLNRPIDTPLLPHKYDWTWLDEIRRTNPYGFASNYQGHPIPSGSCVFKDPTWYSSIPEGTRLTTAYGIDLSYSARTYADWCVIVKVACRMTGVKDPMFYVKHVDRRKDRLENWLDVLAGMYLEDPGPIFWRLGGTELGVADTIDKLLSEKATERARLEYELAMKEASETEPGPGRVELLNKAERARVQMGTRVRIRRVPANLDKLSAAEATSVAWNRGQIPLPANTPQEEPAKWLGPYIEEVRSFTGVGDANDDQVDGTVSVIEGMLKRPAVRSLD